MEDPPLPNAAERTSQSSVVFWTLRGLKQVDCIVTRRGDGFAVCIQRGDEHECFWNHPAATIRELVTVTELVKQKLLRSGWVLDSDFTAVRILEFERGSAAAA
jgi:hypothetical protein